MTDDATPVSVVVRFTLSRGEYEALRAVGKNLAWLRERLPEQASWLIEETVRLAEVDAAREKMERAVSKGHHIYRVEEDYTEADRVADEHKGVRLWDTANEARDAYNAVRRKHGLGVE